jgi:hypothetical protein
LWGLIPLALCGVAMGCGESDGGSAPTESSAHERAVLEVYADFQKAILLVDADTFCGILTNARVEEIERQEDVRVECETAAALGLGSFSDEDREAVRSAQGKSGPDDVEIDGDRAVVTTPSGNEVEFRRERDEWRLDLPIP